MRPLSACVITLSTMPGCGAAIAEAWRWTPTPESPLAGPLKTNALGIADFNADGRPDLAAVNGDPGELFILVNQSGGRFAPPAWGGRMPIGVTASGLLVADVNGDGAADLVVCYTIAMRSGAAFEWRWRLWASESAACRNSLTRFAARAQSRAGRHQFGRPSRCSHCPDRCNAIVWALGDGAGGFTPGTQMFPAGNHPSAPCIDRSSVIVWLAEDAAALRFRRIEFATPGTDSQVLAISDLDGDGVADAVTAGWERPTLAVLLGRKHIPASRGVDSN